MCAWGGGGERERFWERHLIGVDGARQIQLPLSDLLVHLPWLHTHSHVHTKHKRTHAHSHTTHTVNINRYS